MDIFDVISTTNANPKPKIDFDQKQLSEMTLPEIASVMEELMAHIEDNPDLTEEEKAIADKLNMTLENKVLAWAWVIKRLKESSELIDVQINHYNDKIKALEGRKIVLDNRQKSRAAFVLSLLDKLGKVKIEGANIIARRSKKRASVKLTERTIDWSKYPGLAEHIPESYKPIKNEIAKYLKTHTSEDFWMSEDEYKLDVK